MRRTEPMSSSSITYDYPGITTLTLYTCRSPLRPTKTAAFRNTFSTSDWRSAVPELDTHNKDPFQDKHISRKKS